MLVIAHRGARGEKPENSIAALRTGLDSGADIIEFDIRVTRDGVPILSHDYLMYRMHHKLDFITRHTLAELEKKTTGSDHEVVTLEQALDECLGKIIIIIDMKEYRAVTPVLTTLKKRLKRKKDWESVMFSSFNPLILRKIRGRVPHASLALLHHRNPLNFIAWQIPLRLTAVGFHRTHLSSFGLKVAQKLGLFTYVYTVNRLGAAQILENKGYDAVVTDFPTQFVRDLEKSTKHT